MKRRSAGSEWPASVTTEVIQHHLPKVHFRKLHWRAVARRFRLTVDLINEHAHPLVPRSMRVDRAARLPRRLNLDSLFTSFDAIPWVCSFDDQVGMSIKVTVLS